MIKGRRYCPFEGRSIGEFIGEGANKGGAQGDGACEKCGLPQSQHIRPLPNVNVSHCPDATESEKKKKLKLAQKVEKMSKARRNEGEGGDDLGGGLCKKCNQELAQHERPREDVSLFICPEVGDLERAKLKKKADQIAALAARKRARSELGWGIEWGLLMATINGSHANH